MHRTAMAHLNCFPGSGPCLQGDATAGFDFNAKEDSSLYIDSVSVLEM